MRGITLGVFSAQPVYDVDFQTNVLDVAQTMGYAIPPLEKRMILNRLMVDMKNIGFYQLQDTLANFALGISGYEMFRMIDWKKTGNIYTPYGGLIYNSEGIEGNGVDAYVNTNFNPATMGIMYTLDNASRGTVVQGSGGLYDVNDGIIDCVSDALVNNINTLYAASTTAMRINNGSATGSLSVDFTGTGSVLICRYDSLNVNLFKKSFSFVKNLPSTSIYSGTQSLMKRGNVFGKLRLCIYFMGSSISYEMSQAFRIIYNQFLSDSGLSPIA